MLENTIQSKILKYIRKTYPQAVVWKLTETTNCGIPDILFIHKGRVMFFEVKRPGGRRRPLQEITVDKIKLNNVYAGFVESVDEVKEAIKKEFLDKV